jgi:hypothetical protein
MATRPWVTPEEVKEHTDNAKVKERADKKLIWDIFHAEQFVIKYTHNRFEDPEKYPEIPQGVWLAVVMLAEMYAARNADTDKNSGNYKSETFDDYSYTIADTEKKQENLDLAPLLDEFKESAVNNAVNMKLRKL